LVPGAAAADAHVVVAANTNAAATIRRPIVTLRGIAIDRS
jgi:hypothetical protein